MGYPLQAGQEFESVIYQGTIARLYTLATDPRSNSQLQQRRFLSDVTRMRATMGTWGKAACKYALGSKWSTIIYQCIKADVGGWWSDALEEWEAMPEEQQEDWRSAALYKATYDDLGMIFFCLMRVVRGAVAQYSDLDVVVPYFEADEAPNAAAWMQGTIGWQVQKGIYDELNIPLVTTGSWTREAKAGCYGGYYYKPTTSGAHSYKFFYFGKKIDIGFYKNTSGGTADVYIDGVKQDALFSQYGEEAFQQRGQWKPAKTGFHAVLVERKTGLINLDFVEVL